MKETKFKVGDMVKIVKIIGDFAEYEKYVGETVTIINVRGGEYSYCVEIGGIEAYFAEKELRLVGLAVDMRTI